jgi:hypothetical protein
VLSGHERRQNIQLSCGLPVPRLGKTLVKEIEHDACTTILPFSGLPLRRRSRRARSDVGGLQACHARVADNVKDVLSVPCAP